MSAMKCEVGTVMRISNIEYFVKEVFISLRRNNWMSLASVSTVAVSLFILGMFTMLVLNLNKLAENLESQVQINVYIKEDVNREDIKDLEGIIKDMQGNERAKGKTANLWRYRVSRAGNADCT